MAKLSRRASVVSRVLLDCRAARGLAAATLVAVLPLLGCGGSSGTTGSGGVPAASGGRSGAGSGGAVGSGGQASGGTIGLAGASGSASGGIQGGGGMTAAGATGGAAGGTVTTATGGRGSGGATATGGSNAGGAGVAGKSGTGGAATAGSNGTGGGSAGGRNGAAGAPVGGRTGAGGRGSGGAGGSTASTSALLTELGNAFCAAARGCCMKKGLPTTLTDCEAKFPSRSYGLGFYNNGTETIDNAALATCIAAYKDTASTCAFRPLELACRGVFVGTKSEGAACGKGGTPNTGGSGECKATGRATTCLWTGDSNLSTTTGVCLTPAHGKKGDPCATDCRKNDTCVFDLFTSPGYPTATCFEEDGLYCEAQGQGNDHFCASILPTGGNCQDLSFYACASTDYCDGTGSSYKCRTGSTLGQSCSSSGPDCVWDMSLVCGTSQKCEDLGFAYDTTCAGTPPFP